MEWLNSDEIDKQKYLVLRLYSLEDELVLLHLSLMFASITG